MPSADVVKRYFEAIAARDLETALTLWAPGGVERVVGQRELTAPDGVRAQLGELQGAFPDLAWEVLDLIADGDRVAVRWRATGTFARASIRKLVALNPATVWAGHADPVTGDVLVQLESAAAPPE